MLHACVERFDVMGGRGNILGWDREVNKAWSESTAPTFLGTFSVLQWGLCTNIRPKFWLFITYPVYKDHKKIPFSKTEA
jgi:hypothetical protein